MIRILESDTNNSKDFLHSDNQSNFERLRQFAYAKDSDIDSAKAEKLIDAAVKDYQSQFDVSYDVALRHVFLDLVKPKR